MKLRRLWPGPWRTLYALDFERPLIELEKKIDELKALSTSGSADFTAEIQKLEKKAKKLQTEIFSDLSRWQVVQLSRHTARPYFLDYVGYLFTDFFELGGDRALRGGPLHRRRLRAARRPAGDADRATRRGGTPRRTWRATSGCRAPRATARPGG